MLFTEPGFIFLLMPLLLVGYYWLPLKAKNIYLLLASLFFYWWGEKLFVLMLISIAMNYGFGLLVDRERYPKWAPRFMFLAVVANLGLLAVYKYGNFAIEIANDVSAGFGSGPLALDPDIHLPIGISFFTFQALSYVIDVYRGESKKQTNPLNLGLYIALFPQLIMGPIVRYKDVAEQIWQRWCPLGDITAGLRRFLIGLAKKTLVANACGQTAEICFGAPVEQLSSAVAWIGITAYILQLYFDFSGYSDMAIGLGRMFGFRFPENFNYPYISRSITEMWRRWHMTLSTWFRDYVYIPLGGNRVAPWRTYFNLMLIFVLCGLWHGAAWTFLIWGVWNGVFLIFERLGMSDVLKRMPSPLSWGYTMLSWMIGLVIFNARDFGHAMGYLAAMFGLVDPGSGPVISVGDVWTPVLAWGLIVGTIGAFPVVPWLKERYEAMAGNTAVDIVWHIGGTLLLLAMTFACVLLIAAGAYSPFLYTRF